MIFSEWLFADNFHVPLCVDHGLGILTLLLIPKCGIDQSMLLSGVVGGYSYAGVGLGLWS